MSTSVLQLVGLVLIVIGAATVGWVIAGAALAFGLGAVVGGALAVLVGMALEGDL